MNPVLSQLLSRPDSVDCQKIWQYFFDLTTIPRQSGHEEKVTEYLVNFAKNKGLYFEKDLANNILIEIPASPGHESDPGYIVQSHQDMVCVGNPSPATNGVQPRIDGDWLKAVNTSLGADDGIGLSAALALTDLQFSHGPLALIFTVDEEDGIIGARHLSFPNNLSKYKYLINVDSEEVDEATISSAGGGNSLLTLPIVGENPTTTFSLKIDGLPGGHSGTDINKNRPNGIKMAVSAVKNLKSIYPNLQIVSFTAGQAHNVIPSSAELTLGFGNSPSSFTENLLALLEELPHGVIKMSPTVTGLVETSNNLATVATQGKSIIIVNSTRSSVSTDVDLIRHQIAAIAWKHQATVTQEPAYPGWPADPNSFLVSKVKTKYLGITSQNIKITAIHAGLECSVIVGKFPHLEAISIGPTLRDVHSVNESLHIPSVAIFFSLLRSILC